MVRSRAVRALQILAGVLLLAAPSFAGPPGGPGGPHHGPRGPEEFILRESKSLGLDQKTTQAIQQVVAAQREEARSLEEERDAARKKLGDLLTQEPLDEKAALAQADAIGRIDTAMRKHRLETMFKIRALLTPEQRQKLVAQMKTRHERWQQTREHVADACKEDMAKFCSDATDRRGRRECLRSHRQELSNSCHDALRDVMMRMHHRWGQGSGGGTGGPPPGGPGGGPPPDMP